MRINARSLKHLAFGPVANLLWYNRVVASLASHIGQFVAPDSMMLKTELATLAIATSSPCAALPTKVLCNLSLLGARSQFISLARSSAAARYRVSDSVPAFNILTKLHEEADKYNIEALLCPPMRYWFHSSIFLNLLTLRNEMNKNRLITNISGEARIQNKIYNILSSATHCTTHIATSQYARSNNWWTKFSMTRRPGDMTDPVPQLKRLAALAPPPVLLAAIRTLANAWPTVDRMSHTDSECPFCDCGQDALWHFCACPAVQAIREAFFPRLRGQFDDPFFCFSLQVTAPTLRLARLRFLKLAS